MTGEGMLSHRICWPSRSFPIQATAENLIILTLLAHRPEIPGSMAEYILITFSILSAKYGVVK